MPHYIYRLFINFLLIHYFIYRLVRWSDPQYIYKIRIVYTPKHCSWMNQIEIWFGIINRRLLKRKSYRSIEELKASILRFVEQYNFMAKPFKWTYKGVPLAV